MEFLPLELFTKIVCELSITGVKNMAIANKHTSAFISSFVFVKSYITKQHPDYRPCNEDIIMNQLKYIIRMSKLELKIFYCYFESGILHNKKINFSDEWIQRNDVKKGDIINLSRDQLCIYDKESVQELKHYNSSFISVNWGIIPKSIKMIDEFPLKYYIKLFNEYTFYFDTGPYLDQIIQNFTIKYDFPYKGGYTFVSTFKHKFGKLYTIIYDIENIMRNEELSLNYLKDSKYYYLDRKVILGFISQGYFKTTIFSTNQLIIDYTIPNVRINKN